MDNLVVQYNERIRKVWAYVFPGTALDDKQFSVCFGLDL